MHEKSYLGIDWGMADIGLSIADSEVRIALPLMTLRNDTSLLLRLKEIVEREHVGTIVIGTALRIAQRDEFGDLVEPSANQVSRGEHVFGEALAKYLSSEVHIVYQNEMFTTKMAQQNLVRQGVKHVFQHDDDEAARIILQSWLEKGAGD